MCGPAPGLASHMCCAIDRTLRSHQRAGRCGCGKGARVQPSDRYGPFTSSSCVNACAGVAGPMRADLAAHAARTHAHPACPAGPAEARARARACDAQPRAQSVCARSHRSCALPVGPTKPSCCAQHSRSATPAAAPARRATFRLPTRTHARVRPLSRARRPVTVVPTRTTRPAATGTESRTKSTTTPTPPARPTTTRSRCAPVRPRCPKTLACT
jgi:hypothetical protein